MFTSSGSTGGHAGDAKTIISPNTSFGDIIIMHVQGELSKSCKQHIHASYNIQNMKSCICYNIVVV